MSEIRSGMVRFHADLAPLMRPIDSVEPHPENYNNGDVETLAESIEVNGMYRPIYVQASTGFIIAGNHTWMACKSLAAEKIPAVILDVDDVTAKKIMVADNRIASLAMPDHGQLASILESLSEVSDLTGTGYGEHDLEVIRHLAEIPVEYDEFANWPTLTFQVHPRVKAAFYELTREGDNDPDKFQLLLRLAGWEG